MKTLFVLRHAKSSWDDPSLKDFDRPLNGRGLRAAPLIGKQMRKQKLAPELILCSPARRTRETVALVKEAARLDVPVRFDERIYEASTEQLCEVISQIEERISQAMLIGHNPGLEELLFYLTGEEERMVTAALAQVTLDLEKWGKMRERCGSLDWLVNPKDLGDV